MFKKNPSIDNCICDYCFEKKLKKTVHKLYNRIMSLTDHEFCQLCKKPNELKKSKFCFNCIDEMEKFLKS